MQHVKPFIETLALRVPNDEITLILTESVPGTHTTIIHTKEGELNVTVDNEVHTLDNISIVLIKEYMVLLEANTLFGKLYNGMLFIESVYENLDGEYQLYKNVDEHLNIIKELAIHGTHISAWIYSDQHDSELIDPMLTINTILDRCRLMFDEPSVYNVLNLGKVCKGVTLTTVYKNLIYTMEILDERVRHVPQLETSATKYISKIHEDSITPIIGEISRIAGIKQGTPLPILPDLAIVHVPIIKGTPVEFSYNIVDGFMTETNLPILRENKEVLTKYIKLLAGEYNIDLNTETITIAATHTLIGITETLLIDIYFSVELDGKSVTQSTLLNNDRGVYDELFFINVYLIQRLYSITHTLDLSDRESYFKKVSLLINEIGLLNIQGVSGLQLQVLGYKCYVSHDDIDYTFVLLDDGLPYIPYDNFHPDPVNMIANINNRHTKEEDTNESVSINFNRYVLSNNYIDKIHISPDLATDTLKQAGDKLVFMEHSLYSDVLTGVFVVIDDLLPSGTVGITPALFNELCISEANEEIVLISPLFK